MQSHTIPMLFAALTLTAAACGDSPKRPLGGNCESDSECESGLCVDSVCLDPVADEDGDTLTNGVEGALGTSPFLPDTDADGEDDPDEIDRARLAHLDTDGDGKPDALESALTDADGDCLVDELDPDDAVVDPEGCAADVGDWSCSAIYEAAPVKASGRYRVDPDGAGPEPRLEVECLMNVAGGGWTRLDAGWHAWLVRAPIAPTPPREYLYLSADGSWHRPPRTVLPWSWEVGAALPGVWFFEEADLLGAFDCLDYPVTGAGGSVGFGCLGPGAPSLQAVEGGAASGSAELCRATPTCTPVAIYMRDVPCWSEADNLLGDAGFDAFAKGRTSCWRIPLAEPPTRPGAGVSADDGGAREGRAPALRAEYYDYQGVWLTSLEYDQVALAGHHAYRFSYWARAAAPRPLIAIGTSGTGEESVILSLTTEWRQYELGFAPDQTDIAAHPMILFGQFEQNDTVWIDDASLVDVGPLECTPTAGELLADSGFLAGTACWIPVAWSDDGTSGRFITDPDAPSPGDVPSLRVDHDGHDATVGATAANGPTLAQFSSPLLPRHGYELSFDARGPKEVLRLRLATFRVGNWPLDSEHTLGESWSHITFRWDTPAEMLDTTGAAVELDPIDAGPGTVWLDNVRLVDLGADPCLPSIWTTRAFIPDGEFDFGLRCWTYSAGDDAIVAPDVREAWAGDRLPALRTVFGQSTQPMVITSTPFTLPAGNYALTLRTRASGQRMLYAVLVDGSGAMLASFPIPVTEAWAPSTTAFDIKTDTAVTVQLQTQGGPSDELWVDGLAVEPAR